MTDAAVVGARHVSRWFDVGADRIAAFADATDDWNWIHTDPARAAQSPFGGPVAHGFLTLSLLSAMAYDALRMTGEGGNLSVNYGLDRVRFVAPVPAGSRLRAVFVLARRTEMPGGATLAFDVTMECEGADTPVMVARWLVRNIVPEAAN